ncbi:hypothetical protein GY21_10305 [Cryobacterium roopkundense]|uniref:Uncharacterized protein n=1 Tax=Cryobacterium roopkundense TaxID=1001240 RepID=A0A099J9C6_9MICO|nr:hypothetical protein [Cryobacterium roopkundense]KGJ74660.1 hypothetical protein GY21_10305 [Cryobacterium roopkundense]MBB5640031.1 hypothetical protein [Cryobacterium roopkundense]
MALDAFPTRVLLMQEYGCFPLWDRSPSPDRRVGPFDPGNLGLSAALEARLTAWNGLFEQHMGSTFEWPSPEEQLAFLVQGHLLAGEVQAELGISVLVLYPEDDAALSRVPAGAAPVPNSNVVLCHGPALDRARAPHDVTTVTGVQGVMGPLGPGSRFVPRPSIAEQMQRMPDSEFDALTRGADISRHVWKLGQLPTRILLEAQEHGMPLLDRTPLLERPSDRVDAAVLGLPEALVRRLRNWSARWWPEAPRDLRYLVDGHTLAAEVHEAVGSQVTVLFPEADEQRSLPSIEVKVLVDRLRARQPTPPPVPLHPDPSHRL